jgi:predicted RNA-binding Zn-ribbon protein involved in translation (DUF1610 family)
MNLYEGRKNMGQAATTTVDREAEPVAAATTTPVNETRKCPDCGEEMEQGYIGPPSYVRWWKDRRIVYTTFGLLSGERLGKGIWGNLRGYRCRKCGVVVFKQTA